MVPASASLPAQSFNLSKSFDVQIRNTRATQRQKQTSRDTPAIWENRTFKRSRSTWFFANRTNGIDFGQSCQNYEFGARSVERNIVRAYRSNGRGCEGCQRVSVSRTRKWCRPGARTERDRDPPCRSRRRSRSGAPNCRRSPPRLRPSSRPSKGSRFLPHDIVLVSTPFLAESEFNSASSKFKRHLLPRFGYRRGSQVVLTLFSECYTFSDRLDSSFVDDRLLGRFRFRNWKHTWIANWLADAEAESTRGISKNPFLHEHSCR